MRRVYLKRSLLALTGTAMMAFAGAPAATAGTAPVIHIAQPAPFRQTAATPIEFYLEDGAAGRDNLDLNTLQVTLDGAAVTGLVFSDTSAEFKVGSTTQTVQLVKVAVDGRYNILPEGRHTLEISVRDLDNGKPALGDPHPGNLASGSRSFVVDTTAPSSTLTTPPPSPQVLLPGDSIGVFQGSSAEANPAIASGLQKMQAVVTNPLNQTKTYESAGQGLRWSITKDTANTWSWRWVAPSSDAHFLLPGSYRVTIRAVDVAGNAESAGAANSATILIV